MKKKPSLEDKNARKEMPDSEAKSDLPRWQTRFKMRRFSIDSYRSPSHLIDEVIKWNISLTSKYEINLPNSVISSNQMEFRSISHPNDNKKTLESLSISCKKDEV